MITFAVGNSEGASSVIGISVNIAIKTIFLKSLKSFGDFNIYSYLCNIKIKTKSLII